MHEFAVVVSSIFRPYMVYYTEERDIMTHTTHRKQKAYFFQSRTGIYSGRHIYILLGRFLWFWNLAIFWKKKRCSRKNIPEIIYYGSYFCKIPEKNIPEFFFFWNLASKFQSFFFLEYLIFSGRFVLHCEKTQYYCSF